MMDWQRLLSTRRLGARPPKSDLGRSPFNSDHDKIIYSGAFRRLARKTQVHPLATNDHIHNRLTHSLEVACVGRSLGIRVGKKLKDAGRLPAGFEPADIGDIVQSTCLAHDIGNPPFGHTGEAAIRNWFRSDGERFTGRIRPEEKNDLETFEGNAQGLRVLCSAEYHPYDGGMRLTYATLAAFMKYPWTSLPAFTKKRPKQDKYGVFVAELPLFHEIAKEVGLIPQVGDDWYCRHPLVNLMEAADDFCYGIIDLEDGLEMGILRWEEIYDLLKPLLTKEDVDELEPDFQRLRDGRRPPLLRGKVIDAYVEAAASAFVMHEESFLRGEASDLIALCEPVVRDSVKNAKQLAKAKIFRHPRKIELEIGSYNVISTLLGVMCEAVVEWVDSPTNHSFKCARVMDLIGATTFHPELRTSERHSSHYLALMRVLDFVSGMTDHYATYLAKQFNGMAEAR